jgi:hypothetical protein
MIASNFHDPMALDNDNLKTSKETDKRTDNQKTKTPKDKDMEDNSFCIS